MKVLEDKMIKTIEIRAKHDDRYSANFISEDDTMHYDGYGLRIDGLGGGDYLKLKIDNATGTIIGWVPLTEDTLDELLND